LVEVIAARGGLDGGDGNPVEGTSGIPLCPCGKGRAVQEALEAPCGIDHVAAGEDVGSNGVGNSVLAMITTGIVGGFH
jgi:hypothetical protein